MKAITPILFCSFVLAALSTTQTDAFARGVGGHHGGHEGASPAAPAEAFRRPDDSKYHSVLSHPEEADHSSDFTASRDFTATSGFDASSGVKGTEPERITTLDDDFGMGVTLGDVHEDDVGVAHPESKTQKKQEPKAESMCIDDPYGC